MMSRRSWEGWNGGETTRGADAKPIESPTIRIIWSRSDPLAGDAGRGPLLSDLALSETATLLHRARAGTNQKPRSACVSVTPACVSVCQLAAGTNRDPSQP